jgi:hypothetical protein
MKNKAYIFAAVFILIVIAVLAVVVLSLPDDLTSAAGFQQALQKRLDGVMDVTALYAAENQKALPPNVSIFRYQDEDIYVEMATADTVNDIVSKKLATMRNPLVFFVSSPHLFNKGNLIVSFVGRNEQLLAALAAVLGPELTKE